MRHRSNEDIDRELIEFVKASVRQIMAPRWSSASIVAAGCLVVYLLVQFPVVTDRLALPLSAQLRDIGLLVISAILGFVAARQRFARGRSIGAVCLIASVCLLVRQLQQHF